jgi:hypothetical protein
LGSAGAGAPWDTLGDALEHLTVPALKRRGPRWPLPETRGEAEVEAAKGRDASAPQAELVAAMASPFAFGVDVAASASVGWFRWKRDEFPFLYRPREGVVR